MRKFLAAVALAASLIPGLAQAQNKIIAIPGIQIPLPVVNGECVIGSGGKIVWGSCAGTGTAVTSVTGTAGQITASPTTGDVVLSLPATITQDETFTGTVTLSGVLAGTAVSTYLASPPAIGGTAAAAGSFTNLSSSGTVSGTGFASYLASPPTIGNSAPNTGSFTTLQASGSVFGTGITNLFASPPSIGSTTPGTGAFTALSASGTVSGAGINNLFASPPALGSTAANIVRATTLSATGTVTFSGLSSGVQTSCMGLNASNQIVLLNSACGSGAGSGTVTSVGLADATNGGVTITGASPITTSGTWTVTLNPADLITKTTPVTADLVVLDDVAGGNVARKSTIASIQVAGSGGGTTAFLRADGAWAVPPGGAGGTVTVASAGNLTNHAVVIGDGAQVEHTLAALTDGQLIVGATGLDPAPKTMSGDATLAASGAITVTKTNGVAFAAVATSASASDITTGVLGVAEGGTGLSTGNSGGVLSYSSASVIASSPTLTANTLVKGGGAGATPTNSAVTDNGTTLAYAPGATTLGANGGTGGSIKLFGATSGDDTISVPAAAGTATKFQLPATNGGSGQVLSTDGTGVLSWATVTGTGTVTVAGGGNLTNHAIVLGDGAQAEHTVAAMTNGQILVGVTGADAAPVTMSGDATLASSGAITVTKTNGSAFAASATTDTTSATNISSGSLALARIAAIANQTVLGNGSGGSAVPAALTLGPNLIATATTLAIGVPNATKSADYTVAAGDMGGTLNLTGAHTLTIPAISSTILAANMSVCYANQGTSNWTITSTPTINGLPSTTVRPQGGGCLVSNGTSLDWQPGGAGFGTITQNALPKFLDASPGSAIGASAVTDSGTTLAYAPGVVTLGANAGTGGSVKLFGSATGDATIKVASGAGTATVFQLPASNGTNGQVLQTNGSGVTTWATVSGAGCTTSGSNNQALVDNGAGGCSSLANANYGGTGGAMLTLGNSGVAGALNLDDGTVHSATLQATASAGANTTHTFPNNTGTVAELNLAQTFSATQTFATIGGYNANVATQAGTSCTLATNGTGCSGISTGDCGTLIKFTAATTITVTIPQTLPAGCQVAMVQYGAGVITPAQGTGAAFHWGFATSRAQYSLIGISVLTNSGTNADAIGSGDGA